MTDDEINLGNRLITDDENDLGQVHVSIEKYALHGAAQILGRPNTWSRSCTVQVFGRYGFAFTRGRPSIIGMRSTIIISNMAPVCRRTIFYWPRIQSIPSSIVVPCKFLFA